MRSTNILILLVALNASAAFVGATGLGESAGYEPTVGGDEKIQEANETASNVDAGTGTVESFVGLAVNAVGQLVSIFGVVVAAPRMFINLGAPPVLVTAVAAPLYIIVGLDLLEVLTGRQIT